MKHDPDQPCPFCGAVLQLLSYEQRFPHLADRAKDKRHKPGGYGVLHDRRAHEAAYHRGERGAFPIVGFWT